MKVYISGPITGKPNNNAKAFYDAAWYLYQHKHDWINPLEISNSLPHNSTWLDYIKADIVELMKCEGIYMMKGWLFSRGARIERIIAWLLDIKRIK